MGLLGRVARGDRGVWLDVQTSGDFHVVTAGQQHVVRELERCGAVAFNQLPLQRIELMHATVRHKKYSLQFLKDDIAQGFGHLGRADH